MIFELDFFTNGSNDQKIPYQFFDDSLTSRIINNDQNSIIREEFLKKRTPIQLLIAASVNLTWLSNGNHLSRMTKSSCLYFFIYSCIYLDNFPYDDKNILLKRIWLITVSQFHISFNFTFHEQHVTRFLQKAKYRLVW